MESYDILNQYRKQNIKENHLNEQTGIYESWSYILMYGDTIRAKIRCNNVIQFKNFMEETLTKQNLTNSISVYYYSLQNKDKLIYINIIELFLNSIITAIIAIGIVSTINIINASLNERKEDFRILNSVGTTHEGISKMLIYEGIYMFIKALLISIIISILIIHIIVKLLETVIVLDKILIPYKQISIFIGILFIITMLIMIFSNKFVEKD